MRILVLGGSQFLGRHLAETIVTRGHQLTLFNRGVTHPFLFAASEEIHGDRDHDLGLLRGHTWDVVIDTCGYHPASVGRAAHFLAGAAGSYVFLSSISVYKDFSFPHLNEDSETCRWPDDAEPTDDTPRTYGARKMLCELAAKEAFEDRLLVVRSGVLTGPYDSLGRVAYWLERVGRGGDVLAPGSSSDPLQMLDARDLARWILNMVEARQYGVFNAVGPPHKLTFGDFLNRCQAVTGSESRVVWMPEATLLQEKVAPWTELPLWVPEFMRGLNEIRGDRAFKQGLGCRPLDITLTDTWEWMQEAKPDWSKQMWLTPERETQLLTSL